MRSGTHEASDAFYAWMEVLMIANPETKVWQLAPGELVQLDGARGTTLRVTGGTLWITLERDLRDIVVKPGDAFTIDRGGMTLVEAQTSATVCVATRRPGRAYL